MPDTSDRKASAKGKDGCLAISLQPAASQIRASDGREVPFTRAILMIRNVCNEEIVNVVPHAVLGQEGGTVQDVTSSLSHSAPSSISSDGMVSWDVYDLLLPAHPGTASKVHMFGYRAALNWRFDLAVWVEYRFSGDSETVQTPVSRWALRWSVVDPAAGAVDVTIEKETS